MLSGQLYRCKWYIASLGFFFRFNQFLTLLQEWELPATISSELPSRLVVAV